VGGDNATNDVVNNYINNGVGIVNYRGHGGPGGWGPQWNTANEGYLTGVARNLNNSIWNPIVFSAACLTSKLDGTDETLAEAFVKTDFGASAYLGASREVYQHVNSFFDVLLFENIYTNNVTNIGNILVSVVNDGQVETYDDRLAYLWLGEPSLDLWTDSPQQFNSVTVTDNGSSLSVNTGITGSDICVSSTNSGETFYSVYHNTSFANITTSVRPLYVTITKHNYVTYTTITGGTITTNENWIGNLKILGSLVVSSGKTITVGNGSPQIQGSLTVQSGANLTFKNGSSLIVNGTLIATGTSTNKVTFNFDSTNATTQNGIKVNTGASLYVSNAIIKNAWYGIYCNNTSSSPINNWEITKCNTGIYFSSTNVGISNNYIHNNSMGIALYNSSPTLTLNKISGNSNYGISSSGSTSIPLFGNSPTQGKNKISGNSVGVCAFSNSLPMLGNNSPLYGGYNTLGENTSYNVYAITSGIIFAINNYWGNIPPAPPTSSKIWISNGVILYSPYLSSDPTGLNKSAPLAEDAALALLTKAMNLIEQKNFAEAREICLEIVNNYSDSYAAFNALGLLTQTYDLNEIESTKLIYKTLFNKAGKKLNGVAGLILAELDKGNKLKIVDEVINKFKDNAILEDALFAKFIYYLNDVQDKENAILISNELDKRFPNSITAFDAHNQLGDKDYLGKVYPFAKAGQEQKGSTVSSTVPTEYGLFANYPNPFYPASLVPS